MKLQEVVALQTMTQTSCRVFQDDVEKYQGKWSPAVLVQRLLLGLISDDGVMCRTKKERKETEYREPEMSSLPASCYWP